MGNVAAPMKDSATLSSELGISIEQVDTLLTVFRKRARNNELTKSDFEMAIDEVNAMFPGKPPFDSYSLWMLADVDNNGAVDMDEFMRVLSVFAFGSKKQKAAFWFRQIDVDHSGTITKVCLLFLLFTSFDLIFGFV